MRKMLLIAGTLVVLAAFTGGAKASTLTVYSGGGTTPSPVCPR